MDMNNYWPQLQEYPLIRHFLQAYQYTSHIPSSHILVKDENLDEEFFELLGILQMSAIVAFIDTGKAKKACPHALIGRRENIAAIISRIIDRHVLVPSDFLRVMPGSIDIPCTQFDGIGTREFAEGLLRDITNVTPVVFDKLYNGFVNERGIEKSTKFSLRDEVFCSLLKEYVPSQLTVTEKPFWSLDTSFYQGVITSIKEDDDGNQFTGVTFRKPEGQNYLPYPASKMQEVLYINGVLVGCPINGRTLYTV